MLCMHKRHHGCSCLYVRFCCHWQAAQLPDVQPRGALPRLMQTSGCYLPSAATAGLTNNEGRTDRRATLNQLDKVQRRQWPLQLYKQLVLALKVHCGVLMHGRVQASQLPTSFKPVCLSWLMPRMAEYLDHKVLCSPSAPLFKISDSMITWPSACIHAAFVCVCTFHPACMHKCWIDKHAGAATCACV